MRGSSDSLSVSRSPLRPSDRYVRRDVVTRVRTFLAAGGVYPSEVLAVVAAAMLAEGLSRR